MNYENEIFKVLIEAGEDGLSKRKIIRHVYNSCNSLFEEADYDLVCNEVTNFLNRKSKDINSILERTNVRATYRINYNNKKTQQLLLNFHDIPIAEEEKPNDDLSLSLFD